MTPHPKLPRVLCEGAGDKMILEALADHLGLAGKLVFEDYGGKDTLASYLATLKKSPEFAKGEISRILVTRDADTDAEAAWQALNHAVSTTFGTSLDIPGEVAAVENVGISGWIIPGEGQPGMIETLWLEAARSRGADIFDCLDPFVDCLAGKQGARPHEKLRFALWTIAAEGAGAQDRLSLKYALRNIPADWGSAAFARLAGMLEKIAGD